MVMFLDQLGRFGFAEVVVFGGMPDPRRKWRHQPYVKHVRETCGDDVGAAAYQDDVGLSQSGEGCFYSCVVPASSQNG
jgi:hypothetical protein